ncbi:MAG TPA: hypothetical protein VFQ15_02035 [Jiangellaceae bacterium]|nr:hypothetical protein [Jiangellaceae bacterium]
MRTFTRTFLAAATGVAASAVLVGGAVAGPPLVNDHFEIDDSHIEQEEHEGFCPDLPFLVLFEAQGQGSTLAVHHGDGLAYFGLHVRLSATYTNLDTGRFLSQSLVANSNDLTITDNGDGTITITAQDRVHSTWYDDAGNKLFSDSGMSRFQFIVDTAGTPGNPDDDVFVEDLGLIKQAGHFETDGRDFCADLVEFTS